MKDKKYLLIGIALVLIVVLGLGGFLFYRSSQAPNSNENAGSYDENLPELSPDEIGLEMQANDKNNAVRIVINKADDIESIEFDLVYEADAKVDEENMEGRMQRNIYDELDVNGKSPFETKYYDLGSCSSGTCKFDTGVESVDLVMKVTKTDGSEYQVTDTLEL